MSLYTPSTLRRENKAQKHINNPHVQGARTQDIQHDVGHPNSPTIHQVHASVRLCCEAFNKWINVPKRHEYAGPICRSRPPRTRRCCRPRVVAAQVDLVSTLVDAPATLLDQRASSSRLPRHTRSPLIVRRGGNARRDAFGSDTHSTQQANANGRERTTMKPGGYNIKSPVSDN